MVSLTGAKIELSAETDVSLTVEVTSDLDPRVTLKGLKPTTYTVSWTVHNSTDAIIHASVRSNWLQDARFTWNGSGRYALSCENFDEDSGESACQLAAWDEYGLQCNCDGHNVMLTGAWGRFPED